MKGKKPACLSIDLFLAWVWVCGDQADLDYVFKHHNLPTERFSEMGGCCRELLGMKSGHHVSVIEVDVSRCDSLTSLAGIAAHEAVHAVQNLLSHIGESAQARETPAYLTQYIAQFVFNALQGRINAS